MEKYVYIKLSIPGNIVDFTKPLSSEEYNNIGLTWSDYIDNKWVLLSDELLQFYENNPEASIKEIFDMHLSERTIELAKQEMLSNIEEYDKSSNVNEFLVNNVIRSWLTPEERSNYRSSIDSAKLLSMNSISFFVGDVLLTLPINLVESMLALILIYADTCYIVTKQHKLYIESLNNIEDIDSYDYTQGYPEKINFLIEFNNL